MEEEERVRKFQAEKAKRDAKEALVAASRAEVKRLTDAREATVAAKTLAEAKRLQRKDPRTLTPEQRKFMKDELAKEKKQKTDAATMLRREKAAAEARAKEP